MIAGCYDWEEVEEFGETKEEWFRKFLPITSGIPSHDTFRRVFSLIDPNEFEEAFSLWTSNTRIGSTDIKSHIALDGKTVRRSQKGKAGRALHLLYAWSCNLDDIKVY